MVPPRATALPMTRGSPTAFAVESRSRWRVADRLLSVRTTAFEPVVCHSAGKRGPLVFRMGLSLATLAPLRSPANSVVRDMVVRHLHELRALASRRGTLGASATPMLRLDSDDLTSTLPGLAEGHPADTIFLTTRSTDHSAAARLPRVRDAVVRAATVHAATLAADTAIAAAEAAQRSHNDLARHAAQAMQRSASRVAAEAIASEHRSPPGTLSHESFLAVLGPPPIPPAAGAQADDCAPRPTPSPTAAAAMMMMTGETRRAASPQSVDLEADRVQPPTTADRERPAAQAMLARSHRSLSPRSSENDAMRVSRGGVYRVEPSSSSPSPSPLARPATPQSPTASRTTVGVVSPTPIRAAPVPPLRSLAGSTTMPASLFAKRGNMVPPDFSGGTAASAAAGVSVALGVAVSPSRLLEEQYPELPQVRKVGGSTRRGPVTTSSGGGHGDSDDDEDVGPSRSIAEGKFDSIHHTTATEKDDDKEENDEDVGSSSSGRPSQASARGRTYAMHWETPRGTPRVSHSAGGTVVVLPVPGTSSVAVTVPASVVAGLSGGYPRVLGTSRSSVRTTLAAYHRRSDDTNIGEASSSSGGGIALHRSVASLPGPVINRSSPSPPAEALDGVGTGLRRTGATSFVFDSTAGEALEHSRREQELAQAVAQVRPVSPTGTGRFWLSVRRRGDDPGGPLSSGYLGVAAAEAGGLGSGVEADVSGLFGASTASLVSQASLSAPSASDRLPATLPTGGARSVTPSSQPRPRPRRRGTVTADTAPPEAIKNGNSQSVSSIIPLTVMRSAVGDTPVTLGLKRHLSEQLSRSAAGVDARAVWSGRASSPGAVEVAASSFAAAVRSSSSAFSFTSALLTGDRARATSRESTSSRGDTTRRSAALSLDVTRSPASARLYRRMRAEAAASGRDAAHSLASAEGGYTDGLSTARREAMAARSRWVSGGARFETALVGESRQYLRALKVSVGRSVCRRASRRRIMVVSRCSGRIVGATSWATVAGSGRPYPHGEASIRLGDVPVHPLPTW